MESKEIKRLLKLCAYEDELYSNGYRLIAGVDEVGRGSLAGPLVAAAVILDRKKFIIENLDDSKKIDGITRRELYKKIIKSCICWSVVEISPEVIDEVNVNNANILGFKKAVSKLKRKPDIILSDFLEVDLGIELIPVTNGDQISISIAAASIIAKVIRDKMMVNLGKYFPEYGFKCNKGYGTKRHLLALQKYGPSKIHRLSYTGVLS